MTVNEISSTIINNVSDALSGAILNRAISTGQIEAEIDLLREKLAFEQIRTGKIDLKYFMQSLNSLPIICRDFTRECGAIKSGESIPSIRIPKLMALQNNTQLEYVGLVNKQKRFIVYYDIDDISNHKFRLKTSHSPFVWVDLTPDNEDMIMLYFFNLGKYGVLKYVDVRGSFAKPTLLFPLDPESSEKEYPAPGYIQEMIISTLSERYIRYYRQLNIPTLPNQQQDNIT
jgi:hypothetical protein